MRHIWPIVILASALLAATYDMVSSLPGPDGGPLPTAPSISTAEATSIQKPSLLPGDYIFPLKVIANKRYLVDQNSKPFLMVGDAPQTMVATLSLEEAAAYLANRREYGINALWINLLCNFSDGCNKDATTFDGVAPFLAAGDL